MIRYLNLIFAIQFSTSKQLINYKMKKLLLSIAAVAISASFACADTLYESRLFHLN